MARILFHLIFLLLPFLIFWAYVRFAAGYRERYGHGFYATHWYWVALASLLLFVASFVGYWAFRPQVRDGVYIPPHVEDGELVPGRFEPATPPGNDTTDP